MHNALFGELRSLLQRPSYSQDELLQLLEHAYKQAPSQYVDQWVPYLSQHTLPRIRASQLDDVSRWRKLLPSHAAFEFGPYRQPLEQWLTHPAMAEVTHLDLSDVGLGDAGMAQLVQQANFPRVYWLNLQNNQITAEGVQQLLKASWRSQLRWLNLYGNTIQDTGVVALSLDASLSHLRSLHLGCNGLRMQAYTSLAQSEVFANLIELSLRAERLNPQRLSALFDSPSFYLETLTLGGCQLKDDSVAVLAQCQQLERLSHLNLGFNQFGHEALAQLATSPHTKRVESLALEQVCFADPDAAIVALSKGFEHLQCLNLSSCGLGASSMKYVGAWAKTLCSLLLNNNQLGDCGVQNMAQLFPSLTTLELRKCAIGDVGMAKLGLACHQWSLNALDLGHNEMLSHEVLTQITHTQPQIQSLGFSGLALNNQDATTIANTPWTQLKNLSLAHNNISDQGMIALANSDYFKILRDLAVGNRVGDAGALALAESTSLGGLERIWMMKNQMTNAGVAALERSTTLKQGANIDVYECPCDANYIVVGQHETIL